MFSRYSILVLLLLMLLGCDQTPSTSSSSTGLMPKRQYDATEVARGKKLFIENCAVCHGENAQGSKDWTKPGADGFYPAPPLNGSGHAWHHSLQVLRDAIKFGSKPNTGKMPAWKDKLSDSDIHAIITWFQSLWPDKVYAAWYEMQNR